jgi:hypothetical protein
MSDEAYVTLVFIPRTEEVQNELTLGDQAAKGVGSTSIVQEVGDSSMHVDFYD